MMTSSSGGKTSPEERSPSSVGADILGDPKQAYVWIWLPGAAEPVVAGRLDRQGAIATFTYGSSYLERTGAIPLFLPELPLKRGSQPPLVGEIAGCIADAGPDAWGRRVVEYGLGTWGSRVWGTGTWGTAVINPESFAYLLASGSDRIGALDFQLSPTQYLRRASGDATLEELVQSAERLESGIPFSEGIDRALLHGSSIGGARPKALLSDGHRKLIAKFSSTTDQDRVVKAEYVAMELAKRCGLNVAPVSLVEALGKDVLLVERFDRPPEGGRRLMISALTILGLWEMTGRYASYADLADTIRARFSRPEFTLRELFARIVFNILCGNTDDHARNHAAFWDGTSLELTPAYDICPQTRSGQETAQAMEIGRPGHRLSQLTVCVEAAATYLLSPVQARSIIDHQVNVIHEQWGEVCDLAVLTTADRASLWNRQFLNPYAFYGY
jgi:serine/threonine-protein kinase HipA